MNKTDLIYLAIILPLAFVLLWFRARKRGSVDMREIKREWAENAERRQRCLEG
jgi:hypothetical protein